MTSSTNSGKTKPCPQAGVEHLVEMALSIKAPAAWLFAWLYLRSCIGLGGHSALCLKCAGLVIVWRSQTRGAHWTLPYAVLVQPHPCSHSFLRSLFPTLTLSCAHSFWTSHSLSLNAGAAGALSARATACSAASLTRWSASNGRRCSQGSCQRALQVSDTVSMVTECCV